MNDAPLSVLLLAWDDADPAPAQLGAPLPTGGALQAALTAHVALTVILPQLPAPARSEPALPVLVPAEPAPSTATALAANAAAPPARASGAPAAAGEEQSSAAKAAAATAEALAPTPAAPAGALPAAAVPFPTPPPGPEPGAAVLVGLADLTLAELDAAAPWPGTTAAGRATEPQVPAAPYVGSSAGAIPTPPVSIEMPAPPSAAPPAPAAAAATAAQVPPASTAQPATPDLPDSPGAAPRGLSSGLAPEPAAAHRAATETAEPAADPGPAEAADLSQWAADLTPNSPLAPLAAEAPPAVAGARPAALAALRRPTPPVSAEVVAAAAAFSFRLIQYARFATQRVAGGGETGSSVIFAAAWPTWLAATEIRQRTGRPLVLYVAALPSEQGPRLARGWLLELERQALGRADLVLVSSAALAEQLRARYRLRQPARVLAGLAGASGIEPSAIDLQELTADLLALLRAAAGGPA